MFCEERKIRYSDLAPDRSVCTASLLQFFQDAATEHTESCGYPIETLYAQNSSWLLLSMHLIAEQPIHAKELLISTWPYSFSKASSHRAFLVRNKETGAICARAASIWAYVDTKTGRPKEIPTQMVECFNRNLPPSDVSLLRRLPAEEVSEKVGSFRVLKRDIDTNGHMNNVKYAEYAEEALPRGFYYNEIEIYYKRAACLGDTLLLYALQDASGNVITNLKNENGELYAYVKFFANTKA